MKALIMIIFLIGLILATIFLVPVPYTATEIYTDSQPITVKECKTDITPNLFEYVNRGIDILEGNSDSLIKTCKDVIKYQNVKRERQVTKTATPYMMMTGQVVYRYEVP